MRRFSHGSSVVASSAELGLAGGDDRRHLREERMLRLEARDRGGEGRRHPARGSYAAGRRTARPRSRRRRARRPWRRRGRPRRGRARRPRPRGRRSARGARACAAAGVRPATPCRAARGCGIAAGSSRGSRRARTGRGRAWPRAARRSLRARRRPSRRSPRRRARRRSSRRPAAAPKYAVVAWPVLTVKSLRSMYGARSSTKCALGMRGGSSPNGGRSIAHSKNGSTVTSTPAPAGCAGTIRSTAVLAKTARPARASQASAASALTSSRSRSVALMAFSHAMICSGGADGSRRASPATMCGATNFRIVGPTAVVTTLAVAISSTISSGCVALLIARKPGHHAVAAALADLVDGVRRSRR